MTSFVTKIQAEEIKDSRGNPTIKVSVDTEKFSDSFAVPSGASTGAHEAYVLPVTEAIKNIKEIIAPALIGKDVSNQREVDQIMLDLDGTENKSKLGGNAMIGVSIACAKAAAKTKGIEVFEYLKVLAGIRPSHKVPYFFMNLINGGKHVPEGGPKFQEYMIVPMVDDPEEVVEIGMKVQNSLEAIIRKELGEDSLTLGDEGGFAIRTSDVRKPLEFLREAIKQNNLENKVRLALDVAASSFIKEVVYDYDALIKEFNILSIEDPSSEEDFENFRLLKEKYPKLLIVGDDLTVTNSARLKDAIEKGSINAMIIKPNQVGTLTETLETMKLARENNIELIISHRSGETDDDFIADLAYAFGCFGLKAGAPTKPERMIKYKRLIEIAKK